jgi:hypothetical protein
VAYRHPAPAACLVQLRQIRHLLTDPPQRLAVRLRRRA